MGSPENFLFCNFYEDSKAKGFPCVSNELTKLIVGEVTVFLSACFLPCLFVACCLFGSWGIRDQGVLRGVSFCVKKFK